MAQNRLKEKMNILPVEEHTNSPISNITKTKPVSRVPIPDEDSVADAKRWVDENQK